MTTPAQTPSPSDRATLYAGIPGHDPLLFRAMRFSVHDPAVWVRLPSAHRVLIVRNIEVERAREHADADRVICPEDVVAEQERSGDRETLFAQAAAALLKRENVRNASVHRTTPALVIETIRNAGVAVDCDPSLGIMERRAKDEQEVMALRHAQHVTEQAVAHACATIASATPSPAGELFDQKAQPLTAERLHAEIDRFLIDHGFALCDSIVSCGPHAADPHHRGSGPLRTAQTIIVDVFPKDRTSLYHGDCTRTLVHAASPDDIPEDIRRAHQIVVDAKRASIDAARAGATGDAVHNAAIDVIEASGITGQGWSMPHGTGHGVGLAVHEPPLLDSGGPELVAGDCLTIEPGLYKPGYGGIRIEDMVVVRAQDCENLNTIHEGLGWA